LHDFDVAIVGGGCAGLWAGRTAGNAGARTLLVERSRRIGEKIVCAEGIGVAGIGQFMRLPQECIAATIDKALLFDPRGGCVELDEPACGWVLHKDRFLKHLAAAAEASGADIRVGTEAGNVRPLDSGGLALDLEGAEGGFTVTAGAVVAADGLESGTARRLGIQRPLGSLELFSCAQYRLAPISLHAHAVEFHFGGDVAPGGYAWVFPKGEDIANVGVGVICSGRRARSPLEYLERFRQRRCPEAEILGRAFGGVPSARAPHRTFGRGVFAAGDAARVADPVSGAGIVPGMESAEIAGRAAAAYALAGADGRSVEREYVREVRALFKDRGLRFAVRKVLARMNDAEVGKMLKLAGEYASRERLIGGDPFSLVKFMLKAMPRTFGIVRHLVGV
jgi:digeranylgeranylglycerophospholipid reductase